MHPKHIEIEQFNYNLPEENIATAPLSQRDSAKLLVNNNNTFNITQYNKLAQHLPKNGLICFNETKVINARLYFQKSTGAKIEIFCLEPDGQYPDITSAMLQKGCVYWKCLVGGAAKWKNEPVIKCCNNSEDFYLTAQIETKLTDGYLIKFEWKNNLSFAEVLQHLGEIPLPPYLNRKAEAEDYETYQTMFAKHEGSVAAPTASLHFTPSVIESLAQNNITTTYLTLHVGAGTFKPVKSETMKEHEMHPEFLEVNLDTIEKVLHHIEAGEPIIAVGTTSVRTLESIYWIGNLLHQDHTIDWNGIAISQWAPYTDHSKASKSIALQAVINYLKSKNLNKLITRTQIIIAPGYEFQIVNGIITNFHQPKSTLLLLISAFLGNEWRNMYEFALHNNFRFLSYGDGCLLLK